MCFKPSQPQRIISELKTNSSLSPSYSVQKSLNHGSLFLKPQLSVKYFTKKPTQHTPCHRTHQFLSESQIYIHNFKMPIQINSNTCFGAYSYFAGTQHGNLHQLSVTMSRVTYFILRAKTRTNVSHS